MKIVHLSDTHLGYVGRGIQAVTDDPWREGLATRVQEADVMLGLMRAIDRIVEQVQPDLVIHSGDLFDGSRPSPHIVDFAMAQLRRITDVGIPLVVVEGHQSYPRDHARGHILRLLAHLPRVTVVCDEVAHFTIAGVAILAVPHRVLARDWNPATAVLQLNSVNVLVAHAVADGRPYFTTGRPAPYLAMAPCSRFDYVALGHYHHFSQVPDVECAFYAGSTAMVGWGDFRPLHHFSFTIVDPTASQLATRVLLPTRPMHAYGVDDARGLSDQAVLDVLDRQAQSIPAHDAYCQVVVRRLEPLTRRALSIRAIEDLFANAASLDVQLDGEQRHWEQISSDLRDGGTPIARFERLVAMSDGDSDFKADVLALGHTVLDRASELEAADDVRNAADGHGVDP